MKTFLRRNEKFERGFTIIETIVGIAIFALISLALLNLFGAVLKNVRNNKATLAANSIALEQLEIIRGMDFNNVKTDTGWVPAGPIPSQHNLVRGGTNFLIRTDISWVDDPYDGTGSGDTYPYDYKKVRVRISWANPIGGGTSEIAMSTNVVPPGLEGLAPGKGGLYLTVFDSKGGPLYNAKITVGSATTGYSLTPNSGGRTDVNGNIWIPDLTPADDYHISVTNDGYSTAETYAINNNPASPDYNPSPDKKNASVISQKAVQMGFQIDALGSMNIKTVHFQNPGNWQASAGGTAQETESSMALSGDGKVFVAWADTRDTDKHVYLQKLSYSGGVYTKAWASDVKIADQADASDPKLKILPDGSLFALWSDDRSGESAIYLQKINPANGNLIGGVYAVSHATAGTVQKNPDFTNDQDGNLYIVWEDNREGNWDIYGQKFIPASGTFWGNDLKINSDGDNDQLAPRIVMDRNMSGGVNANNFYVVWQGNQSGNFDILVRKFDKDGAAAFADKVINTDGGSLDQYEPSVVFDGSNNLYAVWADERNSQPDIYLQKLDKSCNDVLAADAKINDDSYAVAHRVNPTIAYSSASAIYVVWEDNRNGNTTSNIYASKIDSSIARQWTYDLILTDKLSSIETNPFTICDSAGRAVTVWQDNRGGTSAIYGAAYTDMGNYTRSNIPVTVTGEKPKGTYKDSNGNDVPIPKYSRVFTSDASGNIAIDASQGGLEWGDYTFSVTSPYNIISIDLPSPIHVDPGAAASVVINVGP